MDTIFKERKIFMLPTEDKTAPIVIDDNSRKLFEVLPEEAAWGYQHLYVVSDEKIVVGDFGINKNDNTLHQINSTSTYKYDDWYKIIATTNRNLKSNYDHFFDSGISLPNIPNSFIKIFVREYNKKNLIKNINVEYQLYSTFMKSMWEGLHLMINIEDNSINIEYNSINIEVKTNYNKEELSQKLIYCVSEIAAELGYAGTSEEMKLWNDKTNEWIKNNL